MDSRQSFTNDESFVYSDSSPPQSNYVFYDAFHDENNNQYYSLENLIIRGSKQKEKVQQIFTIEQLTKLQGLSKALKACFQLRQIIQDHQFGYFFKYPVNPYKMGLKDYWAVIKWPMDLTTIKRKFVGGLYLKASQFHHDMQLMFNNALNYNKNNQNIIVQVKNLLQVYKNHYAQLQNKINLGVLSQKHEQVVIHNSLISKLSIEQTSQIFNLTRLQRLGRLLSLLNNRKKRNLLASMKKKYSNFPVTQQENQRVYFDNLTTNQIYDLLKLAKSIKSTDFDVAKLMSIAVDPLLEGYNQHLNINRPVDEDVESDFEIEDEDD